MTDRQLTLQHWIWAGFLCNATNGDKRLTLTVLCILSEVIKFRNKFDNDFLAKIKNSSTRKQDRSAPLLCFYIYIYNQSIEYVI